MPPSIIRSNMKSFNRPTEELPDAGHLPGWLDMAGRLSRPGCGVGIFGESEMPDTFPKSEGVFWITPEQAAAVKGFVNAGGGFYALHNAAISR